MKWCCVDCRFATVSKVPHYQGNSNYANVYYSLSIYCEKRVSPVLYPVYQCVDHKEKERWRCDPEQKVLL